MKLTIEEYKQQFGKTRQKEIKHLEHNHCYLVYCAEDGSALLGIYHERREHDENKSI